MLNDEDRTVFPLDKAELTLGRSSDCDIALKDPYVSRQQARIIAEQDQVFIESLGRNPVHVNGEPVQRIQLLPGHVIRAGTSELLVQVVDAPTSAAVGTSPDSSSAAEETVFISSSVNKDIAGPRLVLRDAKGSLKSISIEREALTLGREADNDLQLDDPAVSRRHAQILSKKEGIVLTNLSKVNPVQVNAQQVSSKQLFSGDHIRIGPYSLTFESDREQDQGRPIQEGQGLLSIYHLGALAILVLVVLVLGSYFVYNGLYKPWTYDRSIESASAMIESGNHRKAVEELEILLGQNLSLEQKNAVYGLLAAAVVSISHDLVEKQEVKKAKSLLMTFIGQYGGSAAARPAAERLDALRLKSGRDLEAAEAYQRALQEYAAISTDGSYADEAAEGIRRIWRAFQQNHLDKQTLAELLKKAESKFIAKQYITPVEENAYALYKAVLAIDSDNPDALKRIKQMKDFYREKGNHHFQAGRYSRALVYFERYAIIDPDDPEMQSKIKACRSKQ